MRITPRKNKRLAILKLNGKIIGLNKIYKFRISKFFNMIDVLFINFFTVWLMEKNVFKNGIKIFTIRARNKKKTSCL